LAATASLPLSSPFSPSLFPGVGQPCRIAPRRAMGRPRQPGGPHAEDRRVRAGSGSTAGEVKDSSALFTEHPRRTRAPASSATCPARRTAKGTGGFSPSGCSLPRFKRARPAWHGRQATHPLLGFSLSPPPRLHRIGGRRRRAATTSRRAREEPGAGPEQEQRRRQERRRPAQGHRLQPPLVGRREGRSRRRREPDRSRDPYVAGDTYHATPPPFSTRLRLHRRPNESTTATTLFPFLLELCSV
jgi:hypothetical protein